MSLLRPEDAMRTALGRSFELITNNLSKSVGSVHTAIEDDIEKIASCVFVRFRGNDYIVTATHVLKKNPGLPIIVGCADGMGSFAGEFRFLRDANLMDLAIARMPEKLKQKLPSIEFCDISHTESQLASWFPDRCVVFGYPNSKNKRVSGIKLPLKRSAFGFMTGPAQVQKVPGYPAINGRRHIVLDWTGTNVVYLNGTRQNPPALEGISGGAVINLGHLDNLDVLATLNPPMPTIEGIVSDWPHKKFIVGVRFHAMISALDQMDAWPT